MKRIAFSVILIWAALSAMAQDVVALPSPDKQVKMPLFQALQQRHTVRTYQDKAVDDATLAQVLWAACGYNRVEEKKITAASAINAQDIDVYVVKPEGAFRYDVPTNTLVRVNDKDLRPLVASRQVQVATAPVMLVLVSNQAKFAKLNNAVTALRLGALDAGYVSQNIYLACTALGLGTVARATMDEVALLKELHLTDEQVPLLNHPIGWEFVEHKCCKK